MYAAASDRGGLVDNSAQRRERSTLGRIRLLISSPGDVALERSQVLDVVAEYNRTMADHLGLLIQPLDWARDVHPAAGRPQQVINEQLERYEVFVGIMWQRFGTPTGVADSGTEEEFLLAYESWKRTKLPKIMLYFCEAPITPPRSRQELTQLTKIVEFRERIAQDYPQLSATYKDHAAFKDTFRPHLHRLLIRYFTKEPLPLAGGLLALLELHKEACARRNLAFLTPNLLLALLQRADGVTWRSLEFLRPGLAGELRERLLVYDRARAPAGAFVPFRWEERDDILRAGELARQDAAPEVGEKHLLLGVLGSGSTTVKNLEQWLGNADFQRLVGIVREQPDERPAPVATPGLVLPPIGP